MTTCSEHAIKAFASLLGQCKDRHSYLKAALKYCDQHIRDPAAIEAMPFDRRANLYFYPLKLACETKDDNIVAIALNAIQQLIAHGAVNASVAYCAPDVPAPVKKKGLFGLGGSKEEEVAAPTPKADGNAEPIPLVSIIVAAACLNVNSHSEEVQVRVVRNLLMFVSYPDMGVHGKVLLSAINTSYNVFLVSKSVSVQATAKAALSQMIGIIQQRAEAECDGTANSPSATTAANAAAAAAASAIGINLGAVSNAVAAAAAAATNSGADAFDVADGKEDSLDVPAAEIPKPAAAEATEDGEAADNATEEPTAAAAEEEAATTDAPTADGEAEKEESPERHADPNAESGNEPNTSEGESASAPAATSEENATAAAAASSPSAAANAFLSPNAPNERHSSTLLEDAADENTEFGSESERDCFVILRALSKLSAKPLGNEEKAHTSSKQESIEFRGKLQALNMIYHFIMTVGPAYKARRSFRFALRQYVARSLLESCMSNSIEIARVALNTMQRLACDYRTVLQKETMVFFYNILFPVLESTNSSFEHRFVALQVMESVLSDGQAVMDLFVNYDCVVGGTNLVNDLVNRCSKASQTSHVTPNWITPKQDGDLRIQAVRTLSAMTASLVEWINTITPPTPRTGRSRVIGMVTGGDDATLSATIGGAADDNVASPADDDVNRMLHNKRSYEVVTEAFNRKGAKEGIALALSQGLLKDESPEELAAFLLTKGLNKLRIGEYLSPNKPAVKEVLKCFINLFNFEGLEIDEAMRVFLGKFKIQGEAETVDRTMEQFAQRYCEQNPDAFSSAGTAYVLAFSIMMLNTDAHSVHVKEKMQLTDFHRTLRGIDDGKDLPEAFLDGVYSRITTREIKLDGDTTSKKEVAEGDKNDHIFSSLASKKAQGYKREADSVVKTSLAMLTADLDAADTASANSAGSEFITADHPAIAKAFWEAAWTAVLPSLSFPMEESSNQQLVDCCLDGFDKALALTCIFNDVTQREAFLSSLSGFTHLTNTKEMEYKNVKSIVTMMRVATREGDALEASWYDVLKCISSLDKLHIISTDNSNAALLRDAKKEKEKKEANAANKHSFEAHNAEIVSAHFDATELDRIFSRSTELSGAAVVYLIESLCRVSAEELAEASPRTYSLQKLVEVAELNIGRMRYVWSQMWVYLSRHFISVGCSKQQLVAMFVVDGLRQLALKFLARDELGTLGFQRDFMKPFEVIASTTPMSEIRELVIASLGQMVDAKGYNILSGWHTVLTTLGKCSSASEHSVVMAAAEVLHRITLRKMHLLNSTELLTDIINAWSMMGGNAVDKHVALCAIHFIRLMGTVANKGLPNPDDASCVYYTTTADLFESRKMTFISVERLNAMVFAESATLDRANPNTFADFRTWLSVFAALSSLTSVPDHQIRLEAVTTLFRALTDHALVFSAADWEMITGGTILPIFENIFCDIGMLEQDRLARTATTPAEEEAYRSDRKHHIRLLETAFESYTRFYLLHHRGLSQHLPILLNILLSCSARNDPQVTNAGLGKLQIILSTAELDLTDDEWTVIADAIAKSMNDEVQIVEMLESSLASNRVHEATSMVHALVRTLITISASLQNPKMPSFAILTWLGLFLKCHRCACQALDNPAMATSLRKVITGRIVLDLQREACRGLVKCFGKVPVEQQNQIDVWVSSIIRRFSALSPQGAEFPIIHEVVLFLLRFMCDMPDAAFRSLFVTNYGGLSALINNPDALIRKCLSAAFLRLGGVLSIYTATADDASTMELPEAPDLNTTTAPTFTLVEKAPVVPAPAPKKVVAAPVVEETPAATAEEEEVTAADAEETAVAAQEEEIPAVVEEEKKYDAFGEEIITTSTADVTATEEVAPSNDEATEEQ